MPSPRSSSTRDAFDQDELRLRRLHPKRLQLAVVLGVVPPPRLLDARELQDDQPLRLPLPLEPRTRPAADEKFPAVLGDGSRHGLAVGLDTLVIVNVDVDDEIR